VYSTFESNDEYLSNEREEGRSSNDKLHSPPTNEEDQAQRDIEAFREPLAVVTVREATALEISSADV
jgi:hypothetical protein